MNRVSFPSFLHRFTRSSVTRFIHFRSLRVATVRSVAPREGTGRD